MFLIGIYFIAIAQSEIQVMSDKGREIGLVPFGSSKQDIRVLLHMKTRFKLSRKDINVITLTNLPTAGMWNVYEFKRNGKKAEILMYNGPEEEKDDLQEENFYNLYESQSLYGFRNEGVPPATHWSWINHPKHKVIQNQDSRG